MKILPEDGLNDSNPYHGNSSRGQVDQPASIAGFRFEEGMVGLTEHRFRQHINGEEYLRRFLLFIPEGLIPGEYYPLVIALHGTNSRAENYREIDSLGEFETLASRDKFIVAYGDASAFPVNNYSAPNLTSSLPLVGGAWMSERLGGLETDIAYLTQLLAELESFSIPYDNNNVFLTGFSIGGKLAAQAGLLNPEQFRAIAPVMPSPIAFQTQANTAPSMLLIYSYTDPLFESDYGNQMRSFTDSWANAMTLDTKTLEETPRVLLPAKVLEGVNYTGKHPAALASRESRVSRAEYVEGTEQRRLWVYEIDRGGHAMPHQQQYDLSVVEASGTGFRNQDINSIDEIWRFFSAHI